MSKRLTQEEFIKRARAVHGDTDILDEVKYTSMFDKITLICPTHGRYEMSARQYLRGCRCPKCNTVHYRTPQEFIDEANTIHNNKYDYSHVSEFKTHSRVTFVCPIHGEFKQSWKSHLNGCGCPACSNRKKKTTDEFIKEYKEKYNNNYDLSKVNYVNAYTKVCLICPEHGEFWVTPHALLSQNVGCPVCGRNAIKDKNRMSQDELIKRIKEIHGDYYDLSKVKYSGIYNKIELVCPKHGSFWIRPHNILSGGQGCRKCGVEQNANKNRMTQDEFIEKSKLKHGDRYDYSKVKLKTLRNDKICIICHEKDPITGKEHGEFWQTPSDHLCGCGCVKCAKNYSYTLDEFIERAKIIHNNKYDYSKTFFEAYNKAKVIVGCPKHGDFTIDASLHLQGIGCPLCKESKLEIMISNFLTENNINFFREQKFNWLLSPKGHKLKLDFYIPEYNVAIECQGVQHFKQIDFFGGKDDYEYALERDEYKLKLCRENNVKLLYFTNVEMDKYPYQVIKDTDKLLLEIRGST